MTLGVYSSWRSGSEPDSLLQSWPALTSCSVLIEVKHCAFLSIEHATWKGAKWLHGRGFYMSLPRDLLTNKRFNWGFKWKTNKISYAMNHCPQRDISSASNMETRSLFQISETVPMFSWEFFWLSWSHLKFLHIFNALSHLRVQSGLPVCAD